MTAKRRPGLPALLVPGLIVGTAYLYGLRPRIEREAREMAETAARARAQSPPASREAELAAMEHRLREEVRRLEEAGATGLPPGRPESGERLAELLSRHRLVLLEETLDPPAPGSLPEGARKAGRGRLRLLELTGRYLDVLSALQGISEPPVGAVPLRLVMTREGADVRWTLLLWM